MATLRDYIYDERAKLSHDVRIAGVRLLPQEPLEPNGVPAFLGIEYDDASASLHLNYVPTWMKDGDEVDVKLGYNGLNERVWRGFISALPGEDPEYLRTKAIVRGTDQELGVPPDTVTVPMEATATLEGADVRPPLPIIGGVQTHIEHEITIDYVHDTDRLSWLADQYIKRFGVLPRQPSGAPNLQTLTCHGELYKAQRAIQLEGLSLALMTDEDAMEMICELVGISRTSFTEPEVGWYQLDVDAVTERGAPIGALMKLAEIGQLQIVHTKDGVLWFRPVTFAPAPTYAWEYSTTDQTKARIIGTPGQLEVMWNHEIEKFSTGRLNIPFLNYNNERVFARQVRHSFMPDRQVTIVDAWSGSRLGGTTGADPVASFDFRVTRKIHGDAMYLEYQVDASGSWDPGGNTLTYAWTCNRTTIPASLPATKKIAFRVPATVTQPLTLTLVVTSAATGRTDTLAVDLPVNASDPKMEIPAVYASMNNTTTASPNGGLNWNDVSESTTAGIPGALIADGVHAGECAYPFNSGVIKLTKNFNISKTTVLNDAAHGNIKVIEADRVVPGRLWAGTSNGRLLVSRDRGDTWALYKNFGDGFAIWWIATPEAGGVWVGGGDAQTLTSLIRFDPVVDSQNWQSVGIGGHLAADLAGVGAGVYCRAAASKVAGELAIIMNGTVPGGVNVFRTETVLDPLGAGWVRATGLAGGLTDGRGIIPGPDHATFRAFFANRDYWECANGVAYTQHASALPLGESPNHVLWLGLYTGIDAALIAGQSGIYQLLFSEGVADELRPSAAGTPSTMPASSVPRGLAIGAPGVPAAFVGLRLAAMITNLSPRRSTKLLTPDPSWTTPVSVTGITQARPHIYCPTPSIFFVTNNTDTSSDINGASARSGDAGATYAAGLAGLYGVARAADGTLWGFTRVTATFIQTKIYKSIDGGLNWTLVTTIGDGTSQQRQGIRIACHPTDPNIIAVWGSRGGTTVAFTSVTEDGGATWATNTASQPVEGQTGQIYSCHFTILGNDRFVIATITGAAGRNIYISDDKAATWTSKYSESATNQRMPGMGAHGAKVVVMRDFTDRTDGGIPLVSNDSGNTFAELAIDGHPYSVDGAASATADACVYDGPTDTTVLFLDNGKVLALSPTTDAGVWNDITDAIASGTHGRGNLAVIPRT